MRKILLSILLGVALVTPSFSETIILDLPMDDIGYVMSPAAIDFGDKVLLMACVGLYPVGDDNREGFEALRLWTITEDGITYRDLNRSAAGGGLCETCLGSMTTWEHDGELSVLITAVETYTRTPNEYNKRVAVIALYEITEAGVIIDWGAFGHASAYECYGSMDPDCFPMHPTMTQHPVTGLLSAYIEEDAEQLVYEIPAIPAPLNSCPKETVTLPLSVNRLMEDVLIEWHVFPGPLKFEGVEYRGIAAERYGTATFHILTSRDGIEWNTEHDEYDADYIFTRPTIYGDGLWGHSPAFLRTADDFWSSVNAVLWTGTTDGGSPPVGYHVVIKAYAEDWNNHILTRLSEIPTWVDLPQIHAKPGRIKTRAEAIP